MVNKLKGLPVVDEIGQDCKMVSGLEVEVTTDEMIIWRADGVT
jgi:hypothetical protein